jgi:hypothetical protein
MVIHSSGFSGGVIFVFAINSKSTPELKAVQSKERLVDVISLASKV